MYRRDTSRPHDSSPRSSPRSSPFLPGVTVSRRTGVLELSVLGLLADTPMHGYELRKRLGAVLGAFRAFSYGSLYPCLKALVARGWITEEVPTPGRSARAAGGRSRIVYKLTAEGK